MGSKTVLCAGCLSLLVVSSNCGGGDGGEDPASGGAGATGGSAGSGGSSGGTGGTGGTSGSGGSNKDAGTGGGSVDGGGGSSDGSAKDSAGVDGSDAGCADTGTEPNDSIVLATSACGTAPSCELGDCNDAGSKGYGGPTPTVTGVIGPGDVDYFKFDGKDEVGLCQVDARAKTANSGFRLCLFASCKDGSTKVTACPDGLAVDLGGVPGCCRTAPGEVGITYDCTGSASDDDSARITIGVDSAKSCQPYAVDYHF